MMALEELVDKLMEDTHMLKSVIEAGDIDVAVEILEHRESIINILKQIDTPNKKTLLLEIWPEFSEIDQWCRRAIEALRVKSEAEFYQTKTEKHQIRQTRKVHDLYSNNAHSEFGGMFDNKK